jgi:hypothetical protein
MTFPYKQSCDNLVSLNSDGDCHMEGYHYFEVVEETPHFISCDGSSENVGMRVLHY